MIPSIRGPRGHPVPAIPREDFPMTSVDDERTDAIRRRAFEISQRPDSDSDSENWARAERELTRGSSTQTEGERALGPHE
jgi:hypothetical protein